MGVDQYMRSGTIEPPTAAAGPSAKLNAVQRCRDGSTEAQRPSGPEVAQTGMRLLTPAGSPLSLTFRAQIIFAKSLAHFCPN